ncbi:MAG: hypothetical protein UDB11_03410 [Peptococcaceae bacterium]|nr:hypothetical protein [Peptococcaceae bacterium]
MQYRDRVFRNAMFLEVVLELIGIFSCKAALAEVAVIALATTAILWQVFLKNDVKQRGQRKCNSR